MIMPLHIGAGVLALVAGAVAMTATKGGGLHRRAGLVFAGAMLVMASLGTVLAVGKPNGPVLGGLFTLYLVCTGVITVHAPVEQARRWIAGFMVMAFALAAYGVLDAITASQTAAMSLPFAALAFKAGWSDLQVLRAGRIEGSRRVARHLARMGGAMFIATGSFFLGQAKVFPESLRTSGLLAVPVVLVVAYFLYWLVRIRRAQRKSASRAGARSVATHQVPGHSQPNTPAVNAP